MAVLSAWYRLAPQEISHANLATISLSLLLASARLALKTHHIADQRPTAPLLYIFDKSVIQNFS